MLYYTELTGICRCYCYRILFLSVPTGLSRAPVRVDVRLLPAQPVPQRRLVREPQTGLPLRLRRKLLRRPLREIVIRLRPALLHVLPAAGGQHQRHIAGVLHQFAQRSAALQLRPADGRSFRFRRPGDLRRKAALHLRRLADGHRRHQRRQSRGRRSLVSRHRHPQRSRRLPQRRSVSAQRRELSRVPHRRSILFC